MKIISDGKSLIINIAKAIECLQMNGVVYSHFERWYKKCRAGVVLPVEIVDAGGLMDKSESVSPSIPSDNAFSPVVSVTHVNIVFSNGLEVSHHNLSCQSLCGMIEKLEVLC